MGIIDKYRKEKAERKAYDKIIAERTKVAGRQAYAKEAEKQARIEAERRAKLRYARPGGAGVWGTVRAVASGTRKVVSYVKKGKGYKKITRTVRTQARPTRAPMQSGQPQLPWGNSGSSNGNSNGNVSTKDIFGF